MGQILNATETIRCFVFNVKGLTIDQLSSIAQDEHVSPYYLSRITQIKSKHDQLLELGVGLLLERTLKVHSASDIQVAQYGKPYLTDHSKQIGISHAGDLVVLVIAIQAVGIDVEPLPDQVDRNRRLALKRAYGERYDELAEITPQQFSKLWTQVEATVKLDGRGLRLDPRTHPDLLKDVQLQFSAYQEHMICLATHAPAEIKLIPVRLRD